MAVGFAARDKAALSCGLSQPGIMFLTTVFTNVYILARPTGLHNLWPGTDLLEGQRKQLLPAGEGLFPGPCPALGSPGSMGGGHLCRWRGLAFREPSKREGGSP